LRSTIPIAAQGQPGDEDARQHHAADDAEVLVFLRFGGNEHEEPESQQQQHADGYQQQAEEGDPVGPKDDTFWGVSLCHGLPHGYLSPE